MSSSPNTLETKPLHSHSFLPTTSSMDLLTSPHAVQQSLEKLPNNKRSADSWQFETGDIIFAQRSSSCNFDLLQNCDLPPPIKIFSPVEDNERRTTSLLKQQHKVHQQDGELGLNQSVLRALQLSQTRAREAERKALKESIRNEQMAVLLLEESLRLHAARQWVRLLELEISLLQQEKRFGSAEQRREDAVATWCLAWALCLGIAGAGFVLGHYMF